MIHKARLNEARAIQYKDKLKGLHRSIDPEALHSDDSNFSYSHVPLNKGDAATKCKWVAEQRDPPREATQMTAISDIGSSDSDIQNCNSEELSSTQASDAEVDENENYEVSSQPLLWETNV